MHCDRAKDLMGACIDGELTGAERQAVTAHIQSCTRCSADAEGLRRLGRQIANIGHESAPQTLAARIRSDLVVAANLEPTSPIRGAVTPAPAPIATKASRIWHSHPIATLAAACLVTALLTWGATSQWTRDIHVEREIVAAHIRSLLQDSPTQVASSDAHTVKPWFMGRIDFAPDVKDLTPEGFTLAGARLDYVGERRVGAIVYHRRQHVVNVFMWPAAQGQTSVARASKKSGYNVLEWSRGGVTYWAISDLNAGELQQLQSLL